MSILVSILVSISHFMYSLYVILHKICDKSIIDRFCWTLTKGQLIFHRLLFRTLYYLNNFQNNWNWVKS